MATYRSRVRVSLVERLVDAGIGTLAGAALAVMAWLGTVWLLFG